MPPNVQRRAIDQAAGESLVPVDELEVEGQLWTAWDEGLENEIDFSPPLQGQSSLAFALDGGREVEALRDASGRLAGAVVRERRSMQGEIRCSAERIDARMVKLTIRVENVTGVADPAVPRDEALRASFTGAHLLLAAEEGRFVSLLEPPESAREGARSCRNLRTGPVLVGPAPARDVLLSSPIILYDYPQVAKESPGDLYDGTEIDEILTLRTRALTDQEKREARATDPRAARIIDRVDAMAADTLETLHGTVRSLRPAAPWWDPAADASVSPETDSVEIAGVAVKRGSVVRLHPSGHADAQDMFLEGKLATVQGVYLDVDDKRYLAVSLNDDPASELQGWHGRFFYFSPQEVRPA